MGAASAQVSRSTAKAAKSAKTQKKPHSKLESEIEKLIELARWEPVQFVREVLQHRKLAGEQSLDENPGESFELDEFQIELIEAFADIWRKIAGVPTRVNHLGLPFITIRAGHGPGKTHTLGLLCHIFNSAWKGRIVATAPKFDQLKSRLWAAFRRISNRAAAWYRKRYEINDTTVYWFNLLDGVVQIDKTYAMLAETANKPENLAGHHEPYQLVVVDEGSGIPESIVSTIYGALSTGVLQILVIIGNPTREQGWFADSHRKRETASQFFRYHVQPEKSKRVSRDWMRKLITKYGENSPVVRVRVFGQFPGASKNQLIALEWIEAARGRPAPIDGSLPRKRVSVDCGGGGDNETVVTGADHYYSGTYMRKQTRHSFALAEATVKAAQAAIAMFKLIGGRIDEDDFVVDALGVGLGVAGILQKLGYKVIFYQGGSASDNPDRWRNRRVQSYINSRNAHRDGTIAYAEDFFDDVLDWDDFDAQMCSVCAPEGGSEKLDDLMTKADMVKAGIVSPDMADSVAMQFATQAPAARPHEPGKISQQVEDSQIVVFEQSGILAGLAV